MAGDVLGRAEIEIHAVQAGSFNAETGAIAAQGAAKVEKEVAAAGKASGAVKNAENEVKSLSQVVEGKLNASLGQLAGKSGVAGGQINSLKSSLGAMGAATGPVIVGAAAVGAAFFAAEQGVKALTDQAGEVRAFQRVTGLAAEQASQLVGAAQILGVSSETLGRSFVLLSKNIDTNKQKLADHGIQVATTAAGETDLFGTLLNVTDAYAKAGSQQEKTAVALAAFGRGGAALIPILAKGREGIAELEKEAARLGLTLDQTALDKAKNFGRATREMGLAVKGLKIDVGELAVPLATKLVTGLTDATVKLREFAEQAGKMGGSKGSVFDVGAAFARLADGAVRAAGPVGELTADQLGLTDSHHKASAAAQEHARVIAANGQAVELASASVDDLTQSDKNEVDAAKAAAAAEAEHAKAVDQVASASLAAVDKSFALRKANFDLTDSIKGYQASLAAANTAIHDHGAASADAKEKTEALARAQLDIEKSYSTVAQAAADLAREQALANGKTFDAGQYNEVYKQKLGELAATLAPGDPLRQRILGLGADVDSIKTANTIAFETQGIPRAEAEIRALYALASKNPPIVDLTASVHKGNVRLAMAGGTFYEPGPITVGEAGPERIDLLPGGGVKVHTATETARMAGGPMVGHITVPITIKAGGVGDPALIERAVRSGIHDAMTEVVTLYRQGTGQRS